MRILKLSQVLVSVMLVSASCVASQAQSPLANTEAAPFVPSRVTERVDDTKLVRLAGNTHPLARPEFDQGLVEANLPLERIILVMKRSPAQEAALAAFNARQYDPNSPDFHHWLHADEFGRLYGPSDADMATVTGWLQRHGFSIYEVSRSRVSLQFSGTAAQVQEAFHLEMHKYLINGVQHIANDRDPSIPEALAPVVVGVASLHDFRNTHGTHAGDYVKRDRMTGKITRMPSQPDHNDGTSPTPGSNLGLLAASEATGQKNVAKPELTYVNEYDDSVEDIAPYDYATIYNLFPLWNAGITGAGVTVAIVGVSDVVQSDIATFRSSFGLPASPVVTIVNGTDPGLVQDGQGENTLDVEMAGSTAPGATIDLVVSSNTATTGGDVLSAVYIADHETAPIMSGSYGQCELALGTSQNSLYNQTWQQGATAGISIFESAGDEGSAGCNDQNATTPNADQDGLQVNGIASSPYVTAVGGTDLEWPFTPNTPLSTYWNVDNAQYFNNAKSYMPEMVWNSTCTNPFLLNVYTSNNGTPLTSESLCNSLINTTPDLVRISAGLGGVSRCTTPTGTTPASCAGGYAKPSWQSGSGVPADGKRDLPDISTFASYGFRTQTTGIPSSQLLLCMASTSPTKSCDYTDPQTIIYQENGGTSAATPLTAGEMALVLQKVGSAQGLANPVLYQLAATENYTNCNSQTVQPGNNCIFYDITQGSNAQVCYTGGPNCVTNTSGDAAGILSGYSAGKGYDLATGLGSVNVTNLVNSWPKNAATATLSFSPTSLAFPTTAIGATSANQVLTVKNTGNSSVTFTTIALTGAGENFFFIQASTCPSPLTAGASCTVTLNFQPTSAGTESAALTFTDSATGSPQSVSLTGTGAAAGTGLTITPSTLTFASTPIGTTTAAQVVTLKNSTAAAVSFTASTTITGSGAGSFAKTASTCTNPLAAGASCTNSFTFTPASAGALSATVTYTDSASSTPQTVALSGTGASASTGLTITPSTLTFASTPVGTTTAAQMITLKNSTSAAVSFTASTTITGTNASSFAKTASTCSNPLPAGASCTNSITFTPTAAGALSATVTYTDSASSKPQTVALSGTGASASTGLTITPSTLTFASTPVGTTTAAQIITLKNGTSSAVSFTASTTITGSGASSFTKTASTCTNPLPAGASCTNSITFTPAAAGTLTATVTYTDSASSKPQTVALTGTGASASSGLTITPSTLTFASTAVGTTTAAQMITLKNGTSSAVSFTASTTITGTNASSFAKTASTCTNPLPAGSSCTNSITFTPAAAGTLTATVTYTDSASSTPQTVALTGTGASASSGLTITPSSLTFAATTVGTSAATQVITLKNNTSTGVNFTAATTITGANASSFAKTASTCASPLAAGASCTNTITFTPKATGTLSATVTYTDSASTTGQTVSLFGTGK